MNDKELLELAAKAAGYELDYESYTAMNLHRPMACRIKGRDVWFKWNPLTNDADALRLAVKLSIDLLFMPEQELVYADGTPEECRFSEDPYAATRRAIVRAASEIGRGME